MNHRGQLRLLEGRLESQIDDVGAGFAADLDVDGLRAVRFLGAYQLIEHVEQALERRNRFTVPVRGGDFVLSDHQPQRSRTVHLKQQRIELRVHRFGCRAGKPLLEALGLCVQHASIGADRE